MTVDIELRQSEGYLCVTLRGSVGFAESLEILGQVVTAMEPEEASPILIDIRAAEYNLSYPDIAALVTNLGSDRVGLLPKIAVLYHKDRQGEATRFLELYAGNRGYPIRAFTACDEAVQWLGSTTTREAS